MICSWQVCPHLSLSLSLSLSLRFNIHFSRWTWVSQYQNVSRLDTVGAKGGGGDNWSYKTCKASAKSLPPTNPNTQHFTDQMPFLSPNQQCQSTEGKKFVRHMVIKKNCSMSTSLSSHFWLMSWSSTNDDSAMSHYVEKRDLLILMLLNRTGIKISQALVTYMRAGACQ